MPTLDSLFLFKFLNGDFWLTRFVFLRGLGFIYFVAFLSLFQQLRPLFGANGLLPISLFIEAISSRGVWGAFSQLPSLFFINSSDRFMLGLCGLGVLLSFAVMCGVSNGLSMLILWVIYLSFVNSGQIFYGYGWEMMLLEVGFLSIFLYPFLNWSFFPAHHPPPKVVILLLLWVLFRNMLGSGLIKVRGDGSWLDFTALFSHFETQPVPNPLSRYFHFLPPFILKVGVAFNHFVELVVPFFFFMPRVFRVWGGGITIVFQVMLIVSGNLSFLNWLTIVMCIVCFDDTVYRSFFSAEFLSKIPETPLPYSPASTWVLWGVFLVISVLSIRPALNLLSPKQVMNRSYDPLHLVNTYGAFGSVGTERLEVVIKGTTDRVLGPTTHWKEYEFYAKPGDPFGRPPVISPYHYRLDWQVWFAAMGHYSQNPWLIHLVYKLLKNDEDALSLLAYSPFDEGPPRYIKIDLYTYRFVTPGSATKAVWDRTLKGVYLPALDREHGDLRRYVLEQGWKL